MQLEGSGSSSAGPKRGGGHKPVRQGPPVFQDWDRPSGGSRPSAPAPVQRPPTYTDNDRWLKSTAPVFDMNAVKQAQERLKAAELTAQTAPNYSSYTEPEARVVTEFHKTTPEEAAKIPDVLWGKEDSKLDLDPEALRAKARNTLDHALRAQREHALGLDGMGKKTVGKVDQMTWEEYEALPAKQKAAVDFNTALVRAVNRDKAMQDEYKPNETQRSTYDDSIEKIFGEDGGSDLYAPETLAVLRQIKLEDTSADLDDFLGLNAAITEKDLKHLKIEQGPTIWEAEANPVQRDRYNLTENLATSTQKLEQALAMGRQALSNINRETLIDRNSDVEQILGGIAKAPKEMTGFGSPMRPNGDKTMDGYFQEAFEALSNKANAKDTDAILGTIKRDLFKPGEFEAFMAYADARSANAQRFNLNLEQNDGVSYRKPEYFRKMLGLEGSQ